MFKKSRDEEGFDFEYWWSGRTIILKVIIVIGFIILGISLLAGFGLVVMLLWNWLVPEIFGLKQLSFLEAWGLFILCSILFKGVKFGDEGSRKERKRKKQLRTYLNRDESSENLVAESETLENE
ncbi:MAG: hypothetical protein OCD02_15785 [Spirochaetaceae bacterium]